MLASIEFKYEPELNEEVVYVLKDPLSDQVEYVGRTNNPFRRFGEHLNMYHRSKWKESDIKTRWIKRLKKKGLMPKMVVVSPAVYAGKDMEKILIKKIMAKGIFLRNMRLCI